MPLDVAVLPDDVWPRSCAFADGTTLVFATFGATYRTYDYERRAWDAGAVAPTLGRNAALPLAEGTYSVGDAGIVWRDDAVCAQLGSLCNFLVEAGGTLFTGGQLGKLFDARTGRTIHQHRSPLNCGAAFLRDGAPHVAIGAYTGEVLVFRIDPGAEPRHVVTLQLHDNAIKGIAVSGDLLFSVCADRSAVWQRLDTLETVELRRDAHDRIANGCDGPGRGLVRQREPRPAAAPVEPRLPRDGDRDAARALDEVRRGLRRPAHDRDRRLRRPDRGLRPRGGAAGASTCGRPPPGSRA